MVMEALDVGLKLLVLLIRRSRVRILLHVVMRGEELLLNMLFLVMLWRMKLYLSVVALIACQKIP